jgi:3-dehydroquinate synthase
MTGHERLRVELGPRGYDILVGDGLLATAGQWIAPIAQGQRLFVVTDETVAAAHLATLERALDDAGIAYEALVLPPGEQTKGFAHLESLTSRLLTLKVERRSLLAAFGGGVIGDLTGFAASILLRGIDFVQIPTTLLAQVDSSVGGKTGIDTAQGKNLIGSFHQPRLVLADTEVLSTLGRRELLAGYAEIVKYGLINDVAFFDWLETHGTGVIEGDPAARRHAIVTCCAAKAAIVAADERESGARQLLNLGHTFAHALEAELGYDDRLLHGEAVAIGLVMAFDLSVRLFRARLRVVGRGPGRAHAPRQEGARRQGELRARPGHRRRLRGKRRGPRGHRGAAHRPGRRLISITTSLSHAHIAKTPPLRHFS